MLKLIFIFFISVSQAYSADLEKLFKEKKYEEVAAYYDNQVEFKKLTAKEVVFVSYSMRYLGRYRENLGIVAGLVKRMHSKYHIDIYQKMKARETLNPADYPKSLMILYWNIYNDYASILMSYTKKDPKLEADLDNFQTYKSLLSELEYREGLVEKTNDKVTTHIQYLNDLEYMWVKNWSLTYISWQHSSKLIRVSNNTKSNLVITNQGACAGGDVGIENGFYYFAFEGCIFSGSGSVTGYGDTAVTYQQDLSAVGFKAGPSVYKIVSSSRAKIGVSVPIFFTSQKLTLPDDPDYTVEEIKQVSIAPTLSARWQFDKWFAKTEFGQLIGSGDTLWGLGIGRSF